MEPLRPLCMNIIFFLCCKFVDLVVVLDKAVTASIVVF